MLLLVLTLAALPAAAQAPCMAHDELAGQLEKRFGETAVAWGLAAGGSLLEIFASESGSWTLVVTAPRGLSCVRATGEAWSDLPAAELEAQDLST